jgi:hypothetical protein
MECVDDKISVWGGHDSMIEEVMKSLEIPSLRSHQSMEMLATGGPRMHWNTCLGKS